MFLLVDAFEVSLTVGLGHTLQLVLLLDGVGVGRSLEKINDNQYKYSVVTYRLKYK